MKMKLSGCIFLLINWLVVLASLHMYVSESNIHGLYGFGIASFSTACFMAQNVFDTCRLESRIEKLEDKN